jgi:hypothetical protein
VGSGGIVEIEHTSISYTPTMHIIFAPHRNRERLFIWELRTYSYTSQSYTHLEFSIRVNKFAARAQAAVKPQILGLAIDFIYRESRSASR